ncbi:MAG: hypothetical protein OEV94_04365 [Deltaproteobacteria bacterium]|nr:hypothetical protein [Deltaproteobacteria bacterium]
MTNEYAALSTRKGFNRSLSHFRLVTQLSEQAGQGLNLADLVDDLEKDKKIQKSQIGPILNALLVEKFQYQTLSFNLVQDMKTFEDIQSQTEKWNRAEMVAAYHHPQLGISLINPKRKNHWDGVQDLSRHELVVLYVKGVRDQDKAIEPQVLAGLKAMMNGGTLPAGSSFHDAAIKPVVMKPKVVEAPAEAPAPAPAAPVAKPAAPKPVAAAHTRPGAKPAVVPPARGTVATSRRPEVKPVAKPGRVGTAPGLRPAVAPPSHAKGGPVSKPQPPTATAPAAKAAEGPAAKAAAPADGGNRARMTPKYSIQVTNELFHNGNVEAWKNIIESFKVKFTTLEVHIFHDGEKVNDINSLFKWGKVKHGDVLLFSISGEEIQGVAKLQRYLFEGASPRFHNFLKKDVNKALNLF